MPEDMGMKAGWPAWATPSTGGLPVSCLSGRIGEYGTADSARAQDLQIQTDPHHSARAGVGDSLVALPDTLQCRPRAAQDVVAARAMWPGHEHNLLSTEGR